MNPAPLTPELRAAAPALGGGVAAILLGLAELIARAFLRNPLRVGLILPLWNRFKRAAFRVDRLMARIANDTHRPRPPRPARQRDTTPTAAPRPRLRVPAAHAWLLKDLKHEAALYHNRLDRLLSDPANAALVAHTPQLARLLRPLCHMLGLRSPAVPRLPRRRKRPSPPATPQRATLAQPRAGTPLPPPSPPPPGADRCPHFDRWPWVPWQPRHAT